MERSSEKLESFSLETIKSWQLEYNDSKVELPPLQRGFVWKPHQIESLWDSILRGFPIGSFLMSKSEDEKFFLLDGQQRATAITLGYFNPWELSDEAITVENNFWSLKYLLVVWIDLDPKEKTNTQKFVLRVVTKSHPWGYKLRNNTDPLGIPERRKALQNLQTNPQNEKSGYFNFDSKNIFPYDANLPVPLSFLIKAVNTNKSNWKNELVDICKQYNLELVKTKSSIIDDSNYVKHLEQSINSVDFNEDIIKAISELNEIKIPGIIVKKSILNDENEDENAENPTLFVRLNSSGTKIEGEELIYSIYKASFPEAKGLVEGIGKNFMPPSMVISIASRLALSELNNNYPVKFKPNDFIKKIKEPKFKETLRELIGNKDKSPIRSLFNESFKILESFETPPVLIKNLINKSPDLLLLLIQWLKVHPSQKREDKKILSVMTALSFFGKKNETFVKNIWQNAFKEDFWSKENLGIKFIINSEILMPHLIPPSLLRYFLVNEIEKKDLKEWLHLEPIMESEIGSKFKIEFIGKEENEIEEIIKENWSIFFVKLFYCTPLLFFAQRDYLNESFKDFNQIENLEDTSSPWDIDHIYPTSWIYSKRNINQNTRHLSNSIGNKRILSLGINRSESDHHSPSERLELEKAKKDSFVKENDWEYWKEIRGVIKENDPLIKIHLFAILNRLCNIYEEWYNILDVGATFGI